VRALHRLGRDVVRAAEWMLSELGAALDPARQEDRGHARH
jgi:hypothetical protein